eukprot:GHUV01018964.1.p1 GENE.GHUV01018964.1~~GHUV01018964.1.p1  ORF type:complete len:175 (+),score=19.14 GHUV01018964.1:1181-1705(+)
MLAESSLSTPCFWATRPVTSHQCSHQQHPPAATDRNLAVPLARQLLKPMTECSTPLLGPAASCSCSVTTAPLYHDKGQIGLSCSLICCLRNWYLCCVCCTGVVWWIQSVYVSPEHRQQGHFKQLYAAVRDEAQKAGAAGLRLYADDHNKRAHAAYERLGMTSHYKVFEDMFTNY